MLPIVRFSRQLLLSHPNAHYIPHFPQYCLQSNLFPRTNLSFSVSIQLFSADQPAQISRLDDINWDNTTREQLYSALSIESASNNLDPKKLYDILPLATKIDSGFAQYLIDYHPHELYQHSFLKTLRSVYKMGGQPDRSYFGHAVQNSLYFLNQNQIDQANLNLETACLQSVVETTRAIKSCHQSRDIYNDCLSSMKNNSGVLNFLLKWGFPIYGGDQFYTWKQYSLYLLEATRQRNLFVVKTILDHITEHPKLQSILSIKNTIKHKVKTSLLEACFFPKPNFQLFEMFYNLALPQILTDRTQDGLPLFFRTMEYPETFEIVTKDKRITSLQFLTFSCLIYVPNQPYSLPLSPLSYMINKRQYDSAAAYLEILTDKFTNTLFAGDAHRVILSKIPKSITQRPGVRMIKIHSFLEGGINFALGMSELVRTEGKKVKDFKFVVQSTNLILPKLCLHDKLELIPSLLAILIPYYEATEQSIFQVLINQTENLMTPLHWAAYYNKPVFLDLFDQLYNEDLISLPNIRTCFMQRDIYGHSPAATALNHNNIDMLEQILATSHMLFGWNVSRQIASTKHGGGASLSLRAALGLDFADPENPPPLPNQEEIDDILHTAIRYHVSQYNPNKDFPIAEYLSGHLPPANLPHRGNFPKVPARYKSMSDYLDILSRNYDNSDPLAGSISPPEELILSENISKDAQSINSLLAYHLFDPLSLGKTETSWPMSQMAFRGRHDVIHAVIVKIQEHDPGYNLARLLDFESPKGNSALFWAIFNEYTDTARYLIKIGANPLPVSSKGVSEIFNCPLFSKKKYSDFIIDYITVLLERCVNPQAIADALVSSKQKYRKPIFSLLAVLDMNHIIFRLLWMRLPLNIFANLTHTNQSLFHVAASEKSNNNMYPLMEAFSAKFQREFVKHPHKTQPFENILSWMDKDGNTALHIAVSTKNWPAISCLIANSAPTYSKNSLSKETPFDLILKIKTLETRVKHAYLYLSLVFKFQPDNLQQLIQSITQSECEVCDSLLEHFTGDLSSKILPSIVQNTLSSPVIKEIDQLVESTHSVTVPEFYPDAEMFAQLDDIEESTHEKSPIDHLLKKYQAIHKEKEEKLALQKQRQIEKQLELEEIKTRSSNKETEQNDSDEYDDHDDHVQASSSNTV